MIYSTQHTPEVFPLDVVELRAEERPVEAELDHVVPPDAAVEVVVRVVVPAVPTVESNSLTLQLTSTVLIIQH